MWKMNRGRFVPLVNTCLLICLQGGCGGEEAYMRGERARNSLRTSAQSTQGHAMGNELYRGRSDLSMEVYFWLKHLPVPCEKRYDKTLKDVKTLLVHAEHVDGWLEDLSQFLVRPDDPLVLGVLEVVGLDVLPRGGIGGWEEGVRDKKRRRRFRTGLL